MDTTQTIFASVGATLLNGMTIDNFIAYIIASLFGLFLSMGLELYAAKDKIKANGGFNLVYYTQDNALRFIISVCSVIASILYIPDILGAFGIDIHRSVQAAFLMGFLADKLVEALMNKKKK